MILTVNNKTIPIIVSTAVSETVVVEPSPFFYYQLNASTTWTITHNKGYKPLVDIFTLGGMELIGDVVHLSDNVIQVYFNSPMAGFAIIR